MKTALMRLQITSLAKKWLTIVAFFMLSMASFTIAFFEEQKSQTASEKILSDIEKKSNVLVSWIKSKTVEFAAAYNTPFIPITGANSVLNTELSDHRAALFVYKNNSLAYWSSEQVPSDSALFLSINSDTVLYLSNGLYFITPISVNEYSILGVVEIYAQYNYENDYLKSAFNPFLSHEKRFRPCVKDETQDYSVTIAPGLVIPLKINESLENKGGSPVLLLLLMLFSFICFIAAIFRISLLFRRLKKSGIWRWTYLLVMIILGWIISSMIPDMTAFSSNPLFSAGLFAISKHWSSLGILIIDLFWVAVLLSFFVREVISFAGLNRGSTIFRYFSTIIASLLSVMAVFVVLSFLDDVLLNTIVRIEFDDLFTISPNLLLILTSHFLLITCAFLLFFLILRLASRLKVSHKEFLFRFGFVALLLLILSLLTGASITMLLVILVFLSFFELVFVRWLTARPLMFVIVSVIFASALSTIAVNRVNSFREDEEMRLLSLSLATEQDPLAESMYSDLIQGFNSDTILNALIFNESYDVAQIKDYLKSKYFSGYFSKFNLQITICTPDAELIIQPYNQTVQCRSFFDEMVLSMGVPCIAKDLYFINDGSGRGNYLGIVTLEDSTSAIKFVDVYIELTPVSVEKGLGYPELLVDQKDNARILPSDISFVRYLNGEMIGKYGKYKYETSFAGKLFDIPSGLVISYNGYKHLKTRLSDKLVLIISRPAPGFLSSFSAFPYLLFFISLCTFFYILLTKRFWNFRISIGVNFSGRLQWMLVIVIILAFSLTGTITIYNLSSLNSNKNSETINEKAHSLMIEMEHKLSEDTLLNKNDQQYLSDLLIKFSNVFFTDINVYDLNGQLISSSRPQIFTEGLVSDMMNPVAYYQMSSLSSSFFSQTEHIGKMKFTSAYVPIRNFNNQVIGFLNLPYFAKETELNKEISSFITAFINIYFIFFLLSVLIALVVSNYVTKPLRMIKERLRGIKLGSSNDKIDWHRGDEIGGLITDYNRMIDELAEKAEMLARNEREMAWREMAKQVAHEIKNPLTPMKLSTQYLAKAWDEKAPDFQERLQRYTQTLIEQIDSLSNIASEFSNFGKLPETHVGKVCINDVVAGVVSLFRSEEYNISIDQPENAIYVLADESQLIRVFNNLVKNAVQALVDGRKGEIHIRIGRKDDVVTVEVIDNGCGIDETQKKKIFQPNFTTKSSGTGLGLAMVKSIIDSFNGRIWFESSLGNGSVFSITIPSAQAED